ncbi:hypothetical protein B0H14DRAFT_2564728 [Mycena olivaceomarginata]|nr:hypothetical protein B0H14DRAFT_2564728 [Mycena olivaceomarginata]
MDASRRAEEAPSNASLGDALRASLPLPSSSMGKKRAEPDAPTKRPVGRPPKKPKTTLAASQTPKFTVTIPPAMRKTRQSGSNSASAAASTSASVSTSTSDSETSSNVVIEIASDSEMLDDDLEAEDIDAAAVAILGRGDSDYLDAKDDEDNEEQGVDSDEEPEPQEEEEEEENVFDVEFVIPVTSSATDTLTYSSEITHLDFTQNVADEMNIRRRDLEIGYKLSHWTKDVLPRVINTPLHLIRLFNAVREERKIRARAKNPAKKPLQVNIIDLQPKQSDKAEPKKPASKKPKSKASFRWLYPIRVLNILSQASATKAESSDSESGEVQPGKKKTAPQYLRELEAQHKSQGAHNSTSTPPPVMGLPFETGTQAAPRSRTTPNHQPPPPPGPHPYSYYPPPGPYPHAYYPPAPAAHPVPAAQNPPKPSNPDDLDDDESPTLFPKIDDWLLDLDTSERGEDGHGFSKFGAMLRNEGFARVVQILDLGAEGEKELMKICEGMTIGVARLVIKYTKVDCRKICKQEAERKADWVSCD